MMRERRRGRNAKTMWMLIPLFRLQLFISRSVNYRADCGAVVHLMTVDDSNC